MEKREFAKPSAKPLWNEIFFSLNLGFAFWYALFAYVADSYFPSYAPRFLQVALQSFERFLLTIAPLVVSVPRHVHWRSALIWEVGFIAIVAVTALSIFGIRRSLANTWIGQRSLDPIAGVSALGAVPGCWFLVVAITRPELELREHFWSSFGLPFVIEMTIACALTFLVRNRPFWLGTLVFIGHYIFWAYVIGRPFGPPNLSSVVISPIFPLAGFAWLRYSQCARFA